VKRPRPGLRTTIVATVALAVLGTAVALALVAYGVVRSDADSFNAAESGDQHLAINAAVQTNDALLQVIADYAKDHHRGLTPQALTNLVRKHVQQASVLDPADVSEDCSYFPCWSDLPEEARQAAEQGKAFAGSGLLRASRDTESAAVTPITGIGHDWAVATVVPITSYGLSDAELWQRMAVVIAAGFVFAVAVGLAVAFSVRRRLRRIAAAAHRFGEGDLDARVPARGNEEVALLGETFNTMAERLTHTLDELHAAQAGQRRFVADVAHELRSPLSTMLASVDGLQSSTPASQQRSAELLGVQTRRLSRLVDDLLEISRFDAGQAELRTEVVDLAELTADAVQAVAPVAEIPISVRGPAEATVDPRRIHTVIRNLVSNALQHGIPPVAIDVDATDADTVSITVVDDGPGIEPRGAAEIFARFTRGDESRSADGGSGLGLAIARENAMLHGGELTVSDTAPTEFRLLLPRTPPSTATARTTAESHATRRERGSAGLLVKREYGAHNDRPGCS